MALQKRLGGRIDWDAVWYEFLASDFMEVNPFLKEKKAKGEIFMSGASYRRTQGWAERKLAIKSKERKQNLEKIKVKNKETWVKIIEQAEKAEQLLVLGVIEQIKNGIMKDSNGVIIGTKYAARELKDLLNILRLEQEKPMTINKVENSVSLTVDELIQKLKYEEGGLVIDAVAIDDRQLLAGDGIQEVL
jgi:hypothetical protein